MDNQHARGASASQQGYCNAGYGQSCSVEDQLGTTNPCSATFLEENNGRTASHSTAMERDHHTLAQPADIPSNLRRQTVIQHTSFYGERGPNSYPESTNLLPHAHDTFPSSTSSHKAPLKMPINKEAQTDQRLLPNPDIRDQYNDRGPLKAGNTSSDMSHEHSQNSITAENSSVDVEDDNIFHTSAPLTTPQGAGASLPGKERTDVVNPLPCSPDDIPSKRKRYTLVFNGPIKSQGHMAIGTDKFIVTYGDPSSVSHPPSLPDDPVADTLAAKEIFNKQWEDKVEVTEGYKPHSLSEPSDERFPVLANIKGFYMGDLAAKKSQYQKEPVFCFDNDKHAEKSNCPFDYKDLIDTVNKGKEKRIALIGSAGSGKTVTMKRLFRDVSKLLKWPRFGFYFNFRDIRDTTSTTCDLLFAGHDPKHTVYRAYKYLLEHQEDAIFYFDGLDQATWSVSDRVETMKPYHKGSTREIISNIMKRNLFPNVTIIYSSREHAVATLEGLLRPSIIIALAGLAYIDVEWLFIKLVGEGGAELWRKLKIKSPSLVPLCSIPAFLHFTAIVCKAKPENPPKNVTGIMKELISIFMQSAHISERNTSKVLKGLKLMVFNGMIEQKVLFTINDVELAGLEEKELCDWVVKVPAPNVSNCFLVKERLLYYFSHQILEEVLTAYHISEMELNNFKKFVEKNLAGSDWPVNNLAVSDWSVVQRFLSGILFNKEVGADAASKGIVLFPSMFYDTSIVDGINRIPPKVLGVRKLMYDLI